MLNPEVVIKHVLSPLKFNNDFGFYHFGNEYELKEVFASKKYNIKYPVIWLVMPLDGNPTYNQLTKRLDCSIKLILATSTNKEWLNDKRNVETFEKTLEPLFDKVLNTLKTNTNVIIKDNEVIVRKLHNYYTRNQEGKMQQNDYWDVILMEFDAILKEPSVCDVQKVTPVDVDVIEINGSVLELNGKVLIK